MESECSKYSRPGVDDAFSHILSFVLSPGSPIYDTSVPRRYIIKSRQKAASSTHQASISLSDEVTVTPCHVLWILGLFHSAASLVFSSVKLHAYVYFSFYWDIISPKAFSLRIALSSSSLSSSPFFLPLFSSFPLPHSLFLSVSPCFSMPLSISFSICRSLPSLFLPLFSFFLSSNLL